MVSKGVKNPLLRLYRVKQHGQWFLEYVVLAKCKKVSCGAILQRGDLGRVLVVAPHADDELIGCYRLMVDKYSDVKVFYCGYTGSNDTKVNERTRLIEFKEACSDIGVPYVVALNGLDRSLRQEIERYRPDTIMLPSYIDWHLEHRSIHFTLAKVLSRIDCRPQIGLYQISTPIPDRMINFCLPMTKQDQTYKWSLFNRYYVSQRHLPVLRFTYEERVSGSYCYSYAAEVYSVLDYQAWRRQIDLVRIPEVEGCLNDLRRAINQIHKKRARVKELARYFEDHHVMQ